uniref:Uncharacterized protein n=2 Tax=Hucho hucho TaxID=62062 RepID=A0A4W5N1B4_9TELE
MTIRPLHMVVSAYTLYMVITLDVLCVSCHQIMGTHMPCEDRSPSNSPPTSVHALRPGDIKVVAAVGDSLTAGNGVGSGSSVINLLDVRTQYRGLSYRWVLIVKGPYHSYNNTAVQSAVSMSVHLPL